MFDITDKLPYTWGGTGSGSGDSPAPFKVSATAFDVAFGNMPFLIYASDEHPYERASAPSRKEQFDASPQVGEQSLSGWWYRSQSDFSGGAGITYHEPNLGEGSERRFISSLNLDVWGDRVKLNRRLVRRYTGSPTTNAEIAGVGPNLLFRQGTVWRRINSNDDIFELTSLPASARGISPGTGGRFYVGASNAIWRVTSTGVANSIWSGGSGQYQCWYAKGRLIAAQGRDLYALPVSGGTLSGESPFFTHPDPDWAWISAAETPGAIWVAGGSAYSSDIHVVALADDGTVPELSGSTVGLRLPEGESVNKIVGYLDMLLICTNRGLRIAAVQGTDATLGPLLWTDRQAFDCAAFDDQLVVGCAGGIIRRVSFASQLAELRFPYSDDLAVSSSPDVVSVAFYGDRVACAGGGLDVQHPTDLCDSGWIRFGYSRFGTLEPKWFESAMFTGTCVSGSIDVHAAVEDDYVLVSQLSKWSGSQELKLNLGANPFTRLSLQLTLNAGSSASGPEIDAYQVRARPAPARPQTLIRVPVMVYDRNTNRHGQVVGGKGFAWARLRDLEALKDSGRSFIFQDFRTGEARLCEIEQVTFTGLANPDGSDDGFGGVAQVTVRTLDGVTE